MRKTVVQTGRGFPQAQKSKTLEKQQKVKKR
jgi:hypothetical protein